MNTKKSNNITIRIAGDSGDGIQLIGQEFSLTSALMGNDIGAYPDYPAEIRAPVGTVAGVSGFQLQFGDHKIFTAGDKVDALVVMNPAALKTTLKTLKHKGLLIVNQDTFNEKGLKLAEYTENPLENESLKDYSVICVKINSLTQKALRECDISFREKERCKNYFAFGLLAWLYDRDFEKIEKTIEEKFTKKQNLAKINKLAFKAGFAFGEMSELFHVRYQVEPATLEKGLYCNISGNQALAFGLITGAQLAGVKPVYCSYPITPASDLLHTLATMPQEITTFQAEDEIAAAATALGASFAGHLGISATSGPGMNLKMETINLAVMSELPLVIINVQRAGPSTGMPTKTEQSDLLSSLFGRNGESPIVVLSASNPNNCFDQAIMACKLAILYMTPVILLSEAYVANGSEPWKIPDFSHLPLIKTPRPTKKISQPFTPYGRKESTGAREWAIPGQKGYEHVLGGLEKLETTGQISYDPQNHQRMIHLRREKIAKIADILPDLKVNGAKSGKLLVLGWAGNYGSIRTACEALQKEGKEVSWAHLHFINPFPKNLEKIIHSFEKILVPELNLGQLAFILQATFLKKIHSYNPVFGQPIFTDILKEEIKKYL